MDLPKFMGDWYLIYSNIRMWHDDGVHSVHMHHVQVSDTKFKDTISYQSCGLLRGSVKSNEIHGEDVLCGADGSSWTWRGTGAMALLSMECQMLECDPDLAQYAVLYIGGTTFTSPGINVLGRTHRDLPDGLLQAITARISKLPKVRSALQKNGPIRPTARPRYLEELQQEERARREQEEAAAAAAAAEAAEAAAREEAEREARAQAWRARSLSMSRRAGPTERSAAGEEDD